MYLLLDTKSGHIVNATLIPMSETLESDPFVTDVTHIEYETVVEYYTLDGIKVANDKMVPGLYIKRQNGRSSKILVK